MSVMTTPPPVDAGRAPAAAVPRTRARGWRGVLSHWPQYVAIAPFYYDAAKTDGASTWQIFTRVTIPLLRPIILFTVITSTVGGLSLFTEPQVLLGDAGGNGEAGMTIVLYQYNQAFTQFDFGYGSAIAWALFVLASVFAIINWRLLSERRDAPRRTGRKARS